MTPEHEKHKQKETNETTSNLSFCKAKKKNQWNEKATCEMEENICQHLQVSPAIPNFGVPMKIFVSQNGIK